MKKETILEVVRLEDGNIETYIKPFTGMDTILIGVALASATRVAAQVFCKVLNLEKFHVEQLEAQIAQIYNRDLESGGLGEENIRIEDK